MIKFLSFRRWQHWKDTVVQADRLVNQALMALEEDGEDGIIVARAALYGAIEKLARLP